MFPSGRDDTCDIRTDDAMTASEISASASVCTVALLAPSREHSTVSPRERRPQLTRAAHMGPSRIYKRKIPRCAGHIELQGSVERVAHSYAYWLEYSYHDRVQ